MTTTVYGPGALALKLAKLSPQPCVRATCSISNFVKTPHAAIVFGLAARAMQSALPPLKHSPASAISSTNGFATTPQAAIVCWSIKLAHQCGIAQSYRRRIATRHSVVFGLAARAMRSAPPPLLTHLPASAISSTKKRFVITPQAALVCGLAARAMDDGHTSAIFSTKHFAKAQQAALVSGLEETALEHVQEVFVSVTNILRGSAITRQATYVHGSTMHASRQITALFFPWSIALTFTIVFGLE